MEVNILDDFLKIVGVVEYTDNLDALKDKIWCYRGIVGEHRGVALIKKGDHKGEYARVFGFDNKGQSNYAKIISDNDAVEDIECSGNTQIFGTKDFDGLRELALEKFFKKMTEFP